MAPPINHPELDKFRALVSDLGMVCYEHRPLESAALIGSFLVVEDLVGRPVSGGDILG